MPDVEVVVPWRGGCRYRERAWTWVEKQLAGHGWVVTRAEAPAGPWCKAAAVMPAIAASRAATIVVADADVWTPGLPRAVAKVQNGAPWAIPHRIVFRLSEQASDDVLSGRSTIAPGLEVDEPPYRGVRGGGVVVLPRQTALEVPLDPRFTGWGQEDTTWAVALDALAGEAWRGDLTLFHFWHPPQPRMSRRYGSPEGRALARRYLAARHDTEAIRALTLEAAACLSPTS